MRLQNLFDRQVRVCPYIFGRRDLVSGQEFLPIVHAERSRTRQVVRRTFAVNEKPRPVGQDFGPEEIVDVDVPITVEAGRNQEPRVVVEQHVSRFMESTDVIQDF